MENEKNSLALIPIPYGVPVYEDKKTKARTVAFPFDFPDGSHGILMLCRLKRDAWVPAEYIKNVVINFNEL